MKILRSFIYAFNGLKICFSSEINFRIHVLLATLAISLGFLMHLSISEWLVIIGCIAFVIVMEMVNTAIEKLCDVVHQDIHATIKKVKDIAAGAVLLSAAGSLLIGVIIFLPKIIVLLKTL